MSLIQDFFGLHSSNDLPLKTVSPLFQKISNIPPFKNTVLIKINNHLAVIKNVKKIFRIKDNAEAIKKTLDVATGKKELENIFEKHKGTKMKN